jgi:hypothetical protein
MLLALFSGISMFAAYLVVLSVNHQLIEDFLAYAESNSNSKNNGHGIIYYNLFSNLSRDFAGTIEKFKHNNDIPQESGKATTSNNNATTTN